MDDCLGQDHCLSALLAAVISGLGLSCLRGSVVSVKAALLCLTRVARLLHSALAETLTGW